MCGYRCAYSGARSAALVRASSFFVKGTPGNRRQPGERVCRKVFVKVAADYRSSWSIV